MQMHELIQYLQLMINAGAYKLIISNPATRQEAYKKIVVEKKEACYQASKYTEKQVFHEKISFENGAAELFALIANHFRQVNGFTDNEEHMVLISKKGKCTYKVNKTATDAIRVVSREHNRKKKYILEEGSSIAPLVDMGVFTRDGKVVNSMYDKYRQINRFIEIIHDEVSGIKAEELNVIDFGCGKSYLTFVVYYYLTEVMGLKVNMIGLDLKKDVIEKCNQAAQKYHYDHLRFELGDINGYKAPFDVDMVITLHACDTATDFALYNALQWNARMIFSVPCCQHELNKQMQPENLSILSRYGIIKERFAALATDAIRANLLVYFGYRTQLLEFVDFEHTPKNILIRAVKKPMMSKAVKEKALTEVQTLMQEFSFTPMLYELLKDRIEGKS